MYVVTHCGGGCVVVDVLALLFMQELFNESFMLMCVCTHVLYMSWGCLHEWNGTMVVWGTDVLHTHTHVHTHTLNLEP